MAGEWRTWAGDQVARPARAESPADAGEVADAVRSAARDGLPVRMVGSGHSFTPAALTDGVLLRPNRLTGPLAIDTAGGTATVRAGTRLSELSVLLAEHGLALENLGDVDAQTLAGALVTGTHGTGARIGNLASGVEAMELVLADGSELTVDGGDELRAARVGLGALGVVAAVTLRCVPSFRLRAVDRPLPLEEVLGSLDEHVDGNDHFELFTFPHSPVALTRTNNRTDAPPTPRRPRLEWLQDVVLDNHVFGLLNRVARRLPRAIPALNRLAGGSASRRDRVAESFDVFASPRLVRFEEMEYALPRARAAEAVRAARAILERHPVSFPIELRFSAGDDALLSPAHARDTAYVAVHVFEGMSFEAPFREVEAVMRGWDGRPHWGKRSFLSAVELAPRYPCWAEFATIRERLDPEGRFVNAWIERTLL
jgi:L-gulonolactone oxidase